MKFENVKIQYNGREYGLTDYQNFKSKYLTRYRNCSRVAVCMKRTPELIFALLMFIEEEITYIPIDPLYPKERVQFIINNSKPDAILADTGVNDLDLINSSAGSKSDGIMYILFTSGSTGDPKGVEVKRDGVLAFIDGVSEIIDFSAEKRIICLTTVSFDIFFLESIMAIYKGVTVILANDEEQNNPRLIARLIKDNKIDMLQMTPSRMQLLCNYDPELSCLKGIKDIMIGGEPFPLSLLSLLQAKTNAKIYNMYGPTETTIWSTISNLTKKNQIDIGYPIKGTEIYIVDDELSILQNGKEGEICISGEGLAKGYSGRKDLTAEKYVYLPGKPNTKVYRTGDIGKQLPDGNLAYLGRIDNQVKVRGHRIELEEIESHLNRYNGIYQSVVTVREKSETEKELIAFYTSKTALNQNSISEYLSNKLPDYMIPLVFKSVESFFYTMNGKIDRRRVLDCKEIKAEDCR